MQGGFTYRFEDLYWDDVADDKRVQWTCPYKQIFFDLDGTLTGHVNGSMSPYYKYNEYPECPRAHHLLPDGQLKGNPAEYTGGPALNTGLWGSDSVVCDGSVRIRRLQIKNFVPNELWNLRLGLRQPGAGGLNW